MPLIVQRILIWRGRDPRASLIDAPVSAVWELVGEPSPYPEWLPRVFEVQGARLEEGAEFIHSHASTSA
jgi:hypothetical protein